MSPFRFRRSRVSPTTATLPRTKEPSVSAGVRDSTLWIGLVTASLGVWAFFFPNAFFDEFPVAGAHWVSTLGAFNEHLLRDYGSAQIGLGLAAVLVAMQKSSTGIAAVMSGYVVFGTLHLGYHFTTFGFFSSGSAAAQAFALATFITIPLAVIRAIRTRKENTK